MRSQRIEFALVIPALCTLPACRHAPRHTELYKPTISPPAGAARTAAIIAVENLRNLLNNARQFTIKRCGFLAR